MVPDELLDRVARRFSLLGDPTRLRVIAALHEAGSASVGDLAVLSGVPLASVSQHLNRLADAGLVGRTRRGTRVVYSIADPTIEHLCSIVCDGVAPS
jgi:DNA-binding transcriptional ArsR family regulator